MTESIRIYAEGADGAEIFSADSESSVYNSTTYGEVRPRVLVLLESEMHVYGKSEQAGGGFGEYDIATEAGVLKISRRGGDLIRAYGIGMWQQAYEHASLNAQ